MNLWVKDALLDLVVLVGLAIYAFTHNQILEVVIWIYTSLILASKILVLFVDFLKQRASKSQVPDMVYHLIYLASVFFLLYSSNYPLTIAWAIIWVISMVPSMVKKKV